MTDITVSVPILEPGALEKPEDNLSKTSSTSGSTQSNEEAPEFRHSLFAKSRDFSNELSNIEIEFEEGKLDPPKLQERELRWEEPLEQFLEVEYSSHVRTLEDAWQQRQSQKLITLITGPSGTGKSRLAESLIREDRYVLVGRSNPRHTSVPYAPIVHALENLVLQVVKNDEGPSVRQHLLESIGDGVRAITTVVPALGVLLGEEPDTKNQQAAVGDEAVQRWVFLVRNFLRAICELKPTILVLDDIHSYDECTLNLLGFLVEDAESGLLMVGTVNVDKVTPDSILSKILRQWQDRHDVRITDIQLGSLSRESVTFLLTNILDESAEKIHPLATWVHDHTGGNLSSIIESLKWMVRRGLLPYDPENDSWSWEVEEIDLEAESLGPLKDPCSVFLLQRLSELPQLFKELMMAAAAMGSVVDPVVLERILGLKDAIPYLKQASELKFLRDLDDGFVFTNDGIMSHFYEMIKPGDRELFHLEIGRRLWRNVHSDDELSQHVFTILSHMKIGRRLVQRPKERINVARLCLVAGTKAATCSTFRVARIYLEFGVSLLNKSTCWQEDYRLALSLFSALAETEMSFGNFEKMDLLLKDIFGNTDKFEDRLTAYSIQLYAFNVSDRQQDALDLGLDVLKGLDVCFPKKLTKRKLWREKRSIEKLLAGRSDEQLLRLPMLTDRLKLQALNILQLLVLTAILQEPLLAPFLILRMMKITLQDGLSALAGGAFSTYAMILIPLDSMGNIDESFRFAELGRKVSEKFIVYRCSPRVSACYYGVVWSWKKPIKQALEPLLQAYHVGVQTGDSEFASLCGDMYLMHAFETDVPLQVLEREWSGFFDLLVSRRQETTIKMTLPWAQTIHHLLGMSQNPLSPKGDLIDYNEANTCAARAERPCQYAVIQLTRTILHYVMADYEGAALVSPFQPDISVIPPTFERVNFVLYPCLADLAVACDSSKIYNSLLTKREALRKARMAIRRLKTWARCSPTNFLDKLYLLEAEEASLRGQKERALEKYISAIGVSLNSGFLMMHALANERLARHLLRIGEKKDAYSYFVQALDTFGEWGAQAKVTRLQSEIATIRKASLN